jgi:hypothetical protein
MAAAVECLDVSARPAARALVVCSYTLATVGNILGENAAQLLWYKKPPSRLYAYHRNRNLDLDAALSC